jgi:hypothetical protein
MKYRILKVNEGKREYFIVQYKWLFWWSTLQDFWCDHLGGGEFDWEFSSKEKAQEYIDGQSKVYQLV